MYTADEVARWFIAFNEQNIENGAEQISNLKLQKLLYYAQGAILALTGKPLFEDPIVAWKHGPVVKEIYHQYNRHGADGIQIEDGFAAPDIDEDTAAVLREVYRVFGQFSAWMLREMTHAEAPWKETEQSGVIARDKIKRYFEENYLSDGET